MKVFVAILALAVVGSNAELSAKDAISVYDYHRKIGIPRADYLKNAEEEAFKNSARIIGGSTVDISEVPYQVGLLMRITWLSQSVCGGSLIANNKVLTAAHCYYDGVNTAQSFTAVFGSNNVFFGTTTRDSHDITVHPSWDPNTAANDVAILRFSEVTFSNVIQPIDLPNADEALLNFVGEIALTSGYGLTSDNGQIGTNQLLSWVELPVVSNNVCRVTYGPYFQDSNVCASAAGGGSTCSGDSGGPLSVMSNGRRILIGVSSYGADRGCEHGFPVVFARVTSFLSWISSFE